MKTYSRLHHGNKYNHEGYSRSASSVRKEIFSRNPPSEFCRASSDARLSRRKLSSCVTDPSCVGERKKERIFFIPKKEDNSMREASVGEIPQVWSHIYLFDLNLAFLPKKVALSLKTIKKSLSLTASHSYLKAQTTHPNIIQLIRPLPESPVGVQKLVSFKFDLWIRKPSVQILPVLEIH